jgi:hypothetical protein
MWLLGVMLTAVVVGLLTWRSEAKGRFLMVGVVGAVVLFQALTNGLLL